MEWGVELGQLEAFERTHREGSFTRAAEALALTQPAVSTRIAQLEAELGGPLFVRSGRKLALTALGRRFLPYAERALAVLADGLHAVQAVHSGKVGQVTLSSLAIMGIDLLPEPLARFMHENPGVDVLIRRSSTSEIIEQLYDGTAVLGLLGAPLLDRGVQILARFQEDVRAVVTPDHPLAQRQASGEALNLADLTAYIIFNVALHPAVTAFVRDLVETSRRDYGKAMISIPNVMINRMAQLSEGVAFVSISRVQHHVDGGRMVYLKVEDMPRLFSEPLLVALRGRELDPPSAEFVRLIKAHWRHILVG
jgi:DNA-binding transcriptional LysR family regulator